MKSQLKNVNITQVSWTDAENDLRAIRTPVFIVEQLVTPEFEWDELDKSAVHLLAMYKDLNSVAHPIACLRILAFRKIGRMAVLKQWRGMGLGAALLLEAVKLCKSHGSKQVILSAQTHAIGFYTKCGFRVTSDIYQDVHIPHVDMQLELSN